MHKDQEFKKKYYTISFIYLSVYLFVSNKRQFNNNENRKKFWLENQYLKTKKVARIQKGYKTKLLKYNSNLLILNVFLFLFEIFEIVIPAK